MIFRGSNSAKRPASARTRRECTTRPCQLPNARIGQCTAEPAPGPTLTRESQTDSDILELSEVDVFALRTKMAIEESQDRFRHGEPGKISRPFALDHRRKRLDFCGAELDQFQAGKKVNRREKVGHPRFHDHDPPARSQNAADFA